MGVEVNHMNESELNALHERLAAAFKIAGLTGSDLDKAISTAMTASLVEIETHRQAQADRRERVKLVKE